MKKVSLCFALSLYGISTIEKEWKLYVKIYRWKERCVWCCLSWYWTISEASNNNQRKNNAYKLSNLKDAQKVANKLKGEVIEIQESSQATREYDLIYCKECAYFDSINSRRTNMPTDYNDYCSRGLKDYKKEGKA